ncbi:ParB/RepB/Spo0J family partition protein [Roseibium album]|uniref:ParB/RepB/Spo0J family partition protein n=1 Tax=Roseibium album TaxID=311410 RepID=UPI003299D276
MMQSRIAFSIKLLWRKPMELHHIDLTDLKTTALNVRKTGGKDVADLVPSIKSLGVLQPLLVRKNCEGYEIVAGQRRYHALLEIAEAENPELVPCIVMQDGDDAKAIEASLAENIVRLPMDEIDQYKAFAALSKKGASIEDIAVQFGITERLVKQRLALGTLYPPILTAYRREEVQISDLRLLTMATLKQQKAWWKLVQGDDYAPTGYRLKSWLFDGEEIPVSNALFDLEAYKGTIVSDLFGDDQYFADSAAFWELQSNAIAEKMDEYRGEGWSSVILHDVGGNWHRWDCVEVAKDKGGEVHITCAAHGEINFHEGYLDERAYKKRQQAQETGEAVPVTRPELTKPMENYLNLHRHSAVRTKLLGHQDVALRLLVAQFIAGSKADAQKAVRDDISESLTTNKAEEPFKAERQDISALLDLKQGEDHTMIPRKDEWERFLDPYALFAKLLKLDDEAVLRILTFATAETLPSDSSMVEVLGNLLKVDMTESWSPDQTFFDLFKDKEAINAALSDCAGEVVANGNVTAAAKTQKSIIQKCLSGERKDGNKDWQPPYMAFPMQSYTERGETKAMRDWKHISTLFEAA